MRTGYAFLIALLVVIIGVHWSRTDSSVASIPAPTHEKPVAPERRPTAVVTPMVVAVARPLASFPTPKEKVTTEVLERTPVIKELSQFITYDPKFKDIWRKYSEEMYKTVGLTMTEIARLNELERDKFEYATKSLQDSIDEIGDTDPSMTEALQGAKFARMSMEREKAMRDFLGDDRYEYLIQAKETFSQLYEKESGRSVMVSGW